MSLANETTKAASYIKDAWLAVQERGVLPVNKNLANLPAAVDSIPTAPQGDGTLWGTLYTTGYPDGLVLNGKADYDALGNSGNVSTSITVNRVSIAKRMVTKFSFGSACTYAPNFFLANCSELTAIDHAEVLREIGGAFCLSCAKLNCALALTNCVAIGDNFVVNCYLFDGEIEFSEKLTRIGQNFLDGSGAFTQSLAIPKSVVSIGSRFLATCQHFTGPLIVDCEAHPTDNASLSAGNNGAPAYVQGITITGAGALGWRSALPDLNSSPYRKLIYQAPQITFTELKAMLNAGETVPIGAEIPDTWNGNGNPLIVAQQLDSANNSAYGGAVGAILVRKYIEPISQIFGINNAYTYQENALPGYLSVGYYNSSSDELKAAISDIAIPYYNGSTTLDMSVKWFLMSSREICSDISDAAEGIMWDYWKQRTGLAEPSNSSNAGRIMRSRDGGAYAIWLRSRRTGNYVCYVNTSGAVSTKLPTSTDGVLPACFIAKD